MKTKRIVAVILLITFVLLTACKNKNPIANTNSNSSTTNSSFLSSREGNNLSNATSEQSSSVTSISSDDVSKDNGTSSFAPEDDVVSQPLKKDTKLRLELVQYHPGVEGYDLSYDLRVFYDGLPLNYTDAKLSSNLNDVIINKMNVFIPNKVRSTGKTLKITAKYKDECSILSIPLVAWNKTFEDNFDGNILDKSKWRVAEPDVNYDSRPLATTPKDGSIEVGDGNLIMKCEKRNYLSSRGISYNYVHSSIETRGLFNQKYGLFTAKMKLPPASGILHSFWMVADGAYGKDYLFRREYQSKLVGCSEIDVFEYCKPFDNQVTMSEHLWDYNGNYQGANGGYYTIPGFNYGFNEYSLVWTKYALYYYVDGKLAKVVKGLDPTNTTPGFLLFSSYLGITEDYDKGNQAAWNSAWLGFVKDSELPAYTYVDFVRAYSKY